MLRHPDSPHGVIHLITWLYLTSNDVAPPGTVGPHDDVELWIPVVDPKPCLGTQYVNLNWTVTLIVFNWRTFQVSIWPSPWTLLEMEEWISLTSIIDVLRTLTISSCQWGIPVNGNHPLISALSQLRLKANGNMRISWGITNLVIPIGLNPRFDLYKKIKKKKPTPTHKRGHPRIRAPNHKHGPVTKDLQKRNSQKKDSFSVNQQWMHLAQCNILVFVNQLIILMRSVIP